MQTMITIRRWVLRLAIALAIFTPLLFAGAALGARFGLWDWRAGFSVIRSFGPKMALGEMVIIATVVVSIIALILSLLIKPRKGWITALLCLAVPLAAIMHGKNVSKTAQSLPFIHDITTDTQNPPTFSDVILAQRGDKSNPVTYIGKTVPRSDELVSAAQVRGYPDIRSIILDQSPESAFEKALAAAKSMGWKIAQSKPEAGTIDATATTFWFGFKDDIAIRITPSAGGGAVVDIRSISRVGGSDIGANAKRIRAFTKKMKS